MTTEEIESIEITEIGKCKFSFKKIEVSPEQNVNGLFQINGNYYRKIYKPVPELAAANVSEEHIRASLRR